MVSSIAIKTLINLFYTVGERNIMVSLCGSNRRNFRQSRDCWSCDILRSEFYHFLVADSSRKGPLFFVSPFRATRACKLSYVNRFPTPEKKM